MYTVRLVVACQGIGIRAHPRLQGFSQTTPVQTSESVTLACRCRRSCGARLVGGRGYEQKNRSRTSRCGCISGLLKSHSVAQGKVEGESAPGGGWLVCHQYLTLVST